MTRIFRTWSESSPTAKDKLAPVFELRAWDELTKDEKLKIIKHLGALEWFITRRDIELIDHDKRITKLEQKTA